MEAILYPFFLRSIFTKTSFLKTQTLAQEQLNKEVIAGLFSLAKDVNSISSRLALNRTGCRNFQKVAARLSMVVNAFTLRTQGEVWPT